MKRQKKQQALVASLRTLFRDSTNWELLHKVLYKIALGGYTFQNYNGQTVTAEPNLDAIKLLIETAWGRPRNDGNEEMDEQMREQLKGYTDLMRRVVLPDMRDFPDTANDNAEAGRGLAINNN
jgi:hypothetical protein